MTETKKHFSGRRSTPKRPRVKEGKGRPPFKPTKEQRKMVEAMSAVGIPQNDISRVIGITDDTLRKHFRAELDNAETKANAKVAGNLFTQATRNDPRSIPAAIFWCKTRMRWHDKSEVELYGKDGGPIENKNLVRVEFIRAKKDED